MTAGGGGLPAFEIVEKTATGRPKTIRINDENISAATLRDYLGLRSTNFQLTPCPEGLEVKTLGYGHAVGICQYGAKGFALQGKNYQQILQHYYTGVSILKY